LFAKNPQFNHLLVHFFKKMNNLIYIYFFNLYIYIIMPYNLTFDVPSNRDVVDRLRQMDEWIDLRPQYVATNIQPDHFPNRMMVGGYQDREYLQSGTNNRNTPYNFFATMATPSAGSLHLGKIAKSVGRTLKPAAKFAYKEIVKPVAKEFKKEGTKQVVGLAKELLKEAILSAMSSEAGAGAGRKPRKPRVKKGGNVYPSAAAIHSSQRSLGEVGNIASVVRPAVQMALPSDSIPIVPFVSKRGRGRPKSCGAGSGGGSGGKFNLKKALSTASDKVGRYVKEDAVRDLKSVGVHVGREALPYAIGALGQEFGVPAPVGQAVGKMITKRVLSEKMTGVKGGKKPKMIACGAGDGRAKRAAIVKKVMKERGVKMIVASQIVKAEGLYKP
jgi:hypothetical protein